MSGGPRYPSTTTVETRAVWINRLVNAPPLEDVETEVVDRLVESCEFQLLPDRRLICIESQPVSHFVFVIAGRARLFVTGPNRKQVTLEILSAPEHLGEASIFKEGSPSQYSAQAFGETVACLVPADVMRSGVRQSLALAESLLAAGAASSERWARAVKRCAFADVRERIIEVIRSGARPREVVENEDGFVLLPLSHSQIASLASCTKRSAIRVVSEMVERGLARRAQGGWLFDLRELQTNPSI